jgi:hypothetical protein
MSVSKYSFLMIEIGLGKRLNWKKLEQGEQREIYKKKY